MFDQSAGRHRAGAENIAGGEHDAARGVGDDFGEAPIHLRGRSGTDYLVIDQRGHLETQLAVAAVWLEFVGRHQVRAQRDAAVLALGLTDRQLAFQLLQITRGPVVEDHVADDRLFGFVDRQVFARGPDHRGDLQFEVLPDTAGRHRGVVIRAENGCRTGEVERRNAVPGVLEHPAAAHRRLAVAHVVEEAQAVRIDGGRGIGAISVTWSSGTVAAERSASSPASASPAPRPIRSSRLAPGAGRGSPRRTTLRSVGRCRLERSATASRYRKSTDGREKKKKKKKYDICYRMRR